MGVPVGDDWAVHKRCTPPLSLPGIVKLGLTHRELPTSSLQTVEQTHPVLCDSATLAERDELARRESDVGEQSSMRLRMEKLVREKQREIVRGLEALDGKKFRVDEWQRPPWNRRGKRFMKVGEGQRE